MEELLTKSEDLRKVRAALLNVLEDTDELRRSAVDERNKTMAIIENLTDGVILLNKKKQIEIINSPAAELLNISKKEVIGRCFVDLLDIENIPEIKKILIDKDRIKNIYREEVTTLDGLHLEITSVLLKDEIEEKGFLIIIHDVTKEKLIEKIKTEFISVAAHQLRTPLSTIKWTIRMILDGDVGEISEEQRELLEQTYISNERMIRLINDLLDVSRIEEGRLLYNQEDAQMEDVLDSVVENSQEMIRNKNVVLEINKKETPKVRIDKEKIGVVIQNLLENAVKYTEPGGKIKITLDNDEKNVIFKIEDSGVGIPKSQQDRIFTKFFRAENVTRMETDGTGLGLYTIKNIVRAHKGQIWFESEENKGTTFYFTIPINNK
ncbi:MAG: Multi-sensor signal transduction histidine kinase [Parcubacteria bacterium 34_609]|nr:MAG: Multi-sensor signal transduction histidine kinase [Parcubacteria bacterium 34_609]KUK98574.1 MAG: Multi-sensor signal transduction histidine kinase [Parcubacteria bacterium 32_520]